MLYVTPFILEFVARPGGLESRAFTGEWDRARIVPAVVRSARGFTGGETHRAGLASAVAITMAEGVIPTMNVSTPKILGIAAMACGLAWGGARTFGQFGRGDDERQAAPAYSLDRLRSDPDESSRRKRPVQPALADAGAWFLEPNVRFREELHACKQAADD